MACPKIEFFDNKRNLVLLPRSIYFRYLHKALPVCGCLNQSVNQSVVVLTSMSDEIGYSSKHYPGTTLSFQFKAHINCINKSRATYEQTRRESFWELLGA